MDVVLVNVVLDYFILVHVPDSVRSKKCQIASSFATVFCLVKFVVVATVFHRGVNEPYCKQTKQSEDITQNIMINIYSVFIKEGEHVCLQLQGLEGVYESIKPRSYKQWNYIKGELQSTTL